TEKWIACVPYIRLLCASGALYPLSLIHVNVLSAQGRSDLFLNLEIIKKILVVAVVAVTFRYGVTGLLIGNIGVAYLAYYLNSYYSVRLFAYSWSEQIMDLLPYLSLAGLMGGCVWLVSRLPLNGSFLPLILQVVTGIVVYALSSWLCNVSAFADVREMMSRPNRR
ncbi:MAG: polysaccharide biosynthesis C-terminal domain-containing protein, partial [Lacunisphaera sp.]